MLHPMKKTPTSLYGPKPNSKNIQLVFASTYILWVLYYLLVLYTKVFADIINTRLTPVNFLSSNSVREIDLLFLYRMIMISILQYRSKCARPTQFYCTINLPLIKSSKNLLNHLQSKQNACIEEKKKLRFFRENKIHNPDYTNNCPWSAQNYGGSRFYQEAQN